MSPLATSPAVLLAAAVAVAVVAVAVVELVLVELLVVVLAHACLCVQSRAFSSYCILLYLNSFACNIKCHHTCSSCNQCICSMPDPVTTWMGDGLHLPIPARNLASRISKKNGWIRDSQSRNRHKVQP